MAIREAIRLCPVDAALHAEWQKIKDMMLVQIALSTSKALELIEAHASEGREFAFFIRAG